MNQRKNNKGKGRKRKKENKDKEQKKEKKIKRAGYKSINVVSKVLLSQKICTTK